MIRFYFIDDTDGLYFDWDIHDVFNINQDTEQTYMTILLFHDIIISEEKKEIPDWVLKRISFATSDAYPDKSNTISVTCDGSLQWDVFPDDEN